MWEVSYATGLAVPAGLIAGCGAAFWRLVLPEFSLKWQRIWLLCYIAVWYTYIMAVLCDPGYVSLERCRVASARGKASLLAFCSKCRAPKPERAHHCRKCERCVLRMDHHCPWTGNCVGHANLRQFTHFLIAASFETGWTGFAAAQTGYRAWWINAQYPGYLSSRMDVAVLALLIPVALFLCITISALLLRVIVSVANGQTLIEEWERARAATLVRRQLAPRSVFPFDNGIWTNLVQAFGQPWSWFIPFGSPGGDGHSWQRSEEAPRWPPDSEKAREHGFYRRDRWISPDGESLEDFGVDPFENEPVSKPKQE